MRCFSLFVAWICLAAVYAQTPLLPFKSQQKWGFMEKSGNVRVAASYDFVKPFFANGLAIVQQGKLLGLVDTNGKQRIPCEYELLDTTEQNSTMWLARKQGTWQLITIDNQVIMNNVTGKVVGINNDFIKIEHENGLALAHLQRGTLADGDFMDFQIQPNGFILAIRDSVHLGLFSPAGTKILDADYQSLTVNGRFVIAKQKYHWGLWDTLGNLVLPATYDRLRALNDSIIHFTQREIQYLYNTHSKQVLIDKIDTCSLLLNTHFIKIERLDKMGLIDGNGNMIIPMRFQDINIFNDSFFSVYKSNLIGLYSQRGDSLLPPIFTSFRALGKPQLWGINLDDNWGMYHLGENKFLQPCVYSLLSNFNDDVLLAVAGDSTAAINDKGVITWATSQRCTNPALNTNQLTYETGDKERTVLAFDENGYLVDSSRYTNFNKIQIRQRVDITQGRARVRNTIPDSLMISENLYWEFDNRRSVFKWGIRNATTGKWHFPPTYERIRLFKEHGFTLAFAPGMVNQEMQFDRVNILFDCGLVFVNNQKGYPVTLPELLDIRISDFDEGLNVARCVLSNGEHGLIAKNGRILIRGYRYIGEFKDGLARATKAGTLTVGFPPFRNIQGVEEMNTFLPLFEAPFRTGGFGSQKYMTDFWRYGMLVCEGAKWGAIDTTGRLAIPFEYDFIRNFQHGSASVLKHGKWGIINTSNQFLLKSEYGSVDFLPNSDNRLYKITQSDKKYGCIDTMGRLVVPMEYDRVRTASEDAIAVYKNGRWGFIRGDGGELAPCQYMDVHDFKEGLAGVFFKGRWGFINQYGRLAIQNTYPSVGDFSEGLAWVVVNGRKSGYIDTGGGLVISGDWVSLSNFKNGMAVVRDRRRQIGIIDQKGNWVMLPTKKFNKIELLDNKGLARAQIGSKYVLIDTKGKVLSQKYVTLRPFSGGFAAVRKRSAKQTWLPRNDRWGYIDTTGKLVGGIRYERLGDFKENRALFFNTRTRGWGYIDSTGKTVIEPQFFEARAFANGRAIVFTKHDKSGLIDTTGSYIMQPRYNKIINRSETMCVVRRGFEHYYYLSEDLKRLVPLVFEDAHPFADGVAGIKQQGFWGVINRQGLVVLTPKYQVMKNYINGFAQVGIETRYGVANTKGEIIVQPEFEFVQYMGNGIFRVENGDFVGYIDDKGNWIK